MPDEVAEATLVLTRGDDGQSDGDNAANAAQNNHEAVNSPCASSAGKRKRMAGPRKPAQKAARGEGCSSSPGQQRRQQPAAAADRESPAGEQRAQKHRILDLSHIRSFAHAARGALDQLRGAGPRRWTADVTFKSRAVRLSHRIGSARSFSQQHGVETAFVRLRGRRR